MAEGTDDRGGAEIAAFSSSWQDLGQNLFACLHVTFSMLAPAGYSGRTAAARAPFPGGAWHMYTLNASHGMSNRSRLC